MNTLPSPNAGIATGNPQPLPTQQPQKNPQQFDLSQYPDLATALHAMKVVQDEKAKQLQQGLQAGQMAQQQPPVIQQINAALQQIAAERAPVHVPVPVPVPVRGGKGVDTLPTNLGDNYAGGGIVAFNGEDNDQLVEDEYGYLPGEGVGARIKRRIIDPIFKWRDEQQAKAVPTEMLKQGLASALAGKDTGGMRPDTFPGASGPLPPAMKPDTSNSLDDTILAYPPQFIGMRPNLGGTKQDPNLDASRREVINTGIKVPAGPEQSPYLKKIEDLTLAAAGVDPYAKSAELDAKYKSMLGMEPLLEAQRKRVAETQALMDKQREVRSPMQQWLTGFATAKPGGGLGLAAANAAGTYDTAQQGWAKEDLTNKLAINKLLADIDTAQITGNEKLMDASQRGLGALLQQQTGALTAGSHLAGVEESARARIQEAMIRHAELAQRIKQGQDDKDMATLARLEQMAQQEGTRRAGLDAKSIENMSEREFGTRAQEYATGLLNGNTTYQALLAKHKIAPMKAPEQAKPKVDYDAFKQVK